MRGLRIGLGVGGAVLGAGFTASAAPVAPPKVTYVPAQPAASAPAVPGAEQALARINRIREAAGLEKVVLDPVLSRGCQQHARYLHLNQNHSAARGLGMHEELESLPGCTPEGRAAATMSVIARRGSLTEAVDAFLATFYHRVPLLRPGLKSIGMGFHGRTAVINVQGGTTEDGNVAVPYPHPNQEGVPLEFPDELPDPVPSDAPRPAGFPITLQFALPGPEVTGVRATLTDATGAPVRFYLSHPDRPACDFPQMNTVCLIPARPLRPATRYFVTVSGRFEGATVQKSWSFQTAGASQAFRERPQGQVAAPRR